MGMSLIIDGNYILNRNVFPLVKDKMLYGSLYDSLESSLKNFIKMYNFDEIYFVSDSKGNWRKNIYKEYKSNRKKDNNIDWEFVYITYKEFKNNLPKRVKLVEENMVEGDDWFYYLTNKLNEKGNSVLMITNDGDIKQLLRYSDNYINIIINENNRSNDIFLPENYKIWMVNFLEKLPIPSIFDYDSVDDLEMYNFIKKIIDSKSIKEYNPKEVLFEKMVSGDRGDNIKTVWGKLDKNGSLRGLGVKSAEKIYKKYVDYFGDITNFDDEFFERTSDLIIEFKKLDQSEYDKINSNLKYNNVLVNFEKIPDDILNKMSDKIQ